VSNIRVACQTYTWEMLGDAFENWVVDILDWIAEADYQGVEITNTMIGEFAEDPDGFASELRRRSLRLAAYAYARPSGWTDSAALDGDLAGAHDAIAFVSHFPGVQLALGGAANPSREGAREKLDRAISFYNEVGEMAADEGVMVNVHPHSHFGSLLESADEYQYLLDHLSPNIGFGPDTGHIVRGGQDLLACLQTHIHRITHLHLKDATEDRQWVGLGEGVCNYRGVMALLEEAGYDGWVVAEEESSAAREDGLSAIKRNRAYLRTLGY
jgi:inosose dehydratase